MALVQATSATAAGTTVTTAALTTTAGNAVVVVVGVIGSDAFSGLTDNKGNTYTQILAVPAASGLSSRHGVYMATGIIGGAGHTVTFTAVAGNGGTVGMVAAEVSVTNTLDKASSGSFLTPAATTLTAPSVTTVVATELIIGTFTLDAASSSTTFTAGTGYTIPTGGKIDAPASIYQVVPMCLEWKSVVATGAQAPSCTISVAQESQSSVLTLFASVAPSQYFRPVSDVAAGSWTTAAGATTGLYAQLDEATAADTDYVQSAATPANDTVEVALGNLADPLSSTGHVVRYRYQRDVIAGNPIALTVSLVQGSTVIASWAHTDVDDVWTTSEQTLTGGQADSITSYGDLRLRFVANQA